MIKKLLIGAVFCLGAATLSCAGDAYSTEVPSQKSQSELVLLPDNKRLGETFELHVIIYTPSSLNYITDFDLGQGIEVLDFDTGSGNGCEAVSLDQVSIPNLFENTYVFAVCMTVTIGADAIVGDREVTIDVESDGTPVVARGDFYVLPEAPFE